MTFQISVAAQNARLDSYEQTVGTSPILTMRTSAPPANCAAANVGTVLATLNLPSDWMANAAAGSKSKTGTWEDNSADAAGTCGHFRIHDSTGAVCHGQGTVGGPGSGADMIVDNPVFAAGQAFTIISFTMNDNNG